MPRTTFSVRFYFTSDIFYFHFYLFYVYTEIIIYKEKPILTLLKFNYVIYEIIKYFFPGKRAGSSLLPAFIFPDTYSFSNSPLYITYYLIQASSYIWLHLKTHSFRNTDTGQVSFPRTHIFSCTDRAFYVLSIYFLFWSNFYFLILPFYPVWFLEAIFIFKSGISPSKPV